MLLRLIDHTPRIGVAALNPHGGQYILWRFLTPELWWRAHPYSLSGSAG